MAFLPINRRRFLQLSAAGAAAAAGVDSFLVAPNLPRVIRKDIALKRWPSRLDGFTIALLSDFHYDPLFSVHPIRRSVEIVNGLHPDVIALTGDFVSVPLLGDPARGAEQAEPCSEVLADLKAPYGLWAVMGNHDVLSDTNRVISALTEKGIQILTHRSIPIEKNGGRFWLTGVDDALEGHPDLVKALHDVPAGEPSVLLVHEPDYADYAARYPVDLQLSGHSHGGQVRLPGIPPLFLPDLAKKYVWGLYKIGELTLYTNAGIGTVRMAARLNCPPEVTMITLRRGV